MAQGRALPRRTIDGYLTGLERGHGISLDAVHNEVAATSDLAAAIYVYPRTASGNVPPLRKIQGDKTQLVYPEEIFIDAVNNEIFVNNTGDRSILVFSRTANGNVAPLRVLRGPATGLVETYGIWVNTSTNELWTVNALPYFKSVAELNEYERLNTPALMVFPRTAHGDVAPIRRIFGDRTTLGKPRAFAFDTKNSEVFLTSFSTEFGKDVHSPSTQVGFVTVFDMRQSGNIAPKRVLTANTVNLPVGLFVSPEHEEMGLLEAHENMVMIFPRAW